MKLVTDAPKVQDSKAYDEATSHFRVIPEGYYLGVVKSATWRETDKADFIDVDVDVLMPDGNHVWLRKFGIRATTKENGRYTVDEKGSQLWLLAKYFLVATGVATYDNGELEFEPANLAKISGLILKVKIKTETYTRKSDGADRAKNALSSVFNIAEDFSLLTTDGELVSKISGVAVNDVMHTYLGEAFSDGNQVYLNSDAFEAYQAEAETVEL